MRIYLFSDFLTRSDTNQAVQLQLMLTDCEIMDLGSRRIVFSRTPDRVFRIFYPFQ